VFAWMRTLKYHNSLDQSQLLSGHCSSSSGSYLFTTFNLNEAASALPSGMSKMVRAGPFRSRLMNPARSIRDNDRRTVMGTTPMSCPIFASVTMANPLPLAYRHR
jgi:hypothetical protein